jgi:thiamine pyrophosphate-dependent acetolactate synthase large subunit-like protein
MEKFMPTVADQMVETLAAAGVERIYGIEGDSLKASPTRFDGMAG